MNDKTIQHHIDSQVREEHQWRDSAAAPGANASRLREVERQLHQCCGLLRAPAVWSQSGLGLFATAGPAVSMRMGALEGAKVVGGLSAVGVALTQMGVPKCPVRHITVAWT